MGRAVAQSVEGATLDEEVLGSILVAAARSLPTGRVGVSIMWRAETEVMVSPLCLVCGSTYNCQTSVLGHVSDIA